MSRTIVITGATGFIGGVLAKRLSSPECRIRALVRSASYNKRPRDIEVDWVTGDLDNIESLQRLVSGADAIVHCAGNVRGAVQNDFDRVNVDGVAQLVKVAAQFSPTPRFLLISSLAAREPQLSHYASSKLRGEEALANSSGNMFWSVMRPPAVYGPGDREMRPLFQWMLRGFAPLIGSDKNRVSLIYVQDLVDAIVSWLDSSCQPQQFYELHDGHENGYSWQEIIETVERLRGNSVFRTNIPIPLVNAIASMNLMIANVLGSSPILTPGKVRELTHANWVANNHLLSSQTGWAPKTSLEKGLRQTFESVI